MKINGPITQKKAVDLSDLISPPPGLPRSRLRRIFDKGEESNLPPLAGGIKGGGEMAFTFVWVIIPKISDKPDSGSNISPNLPPLL